MKKRSFARTSALAALGLLGSLDVYALGLGQIEVFSSLNEPFSAEIPLTAVRDRQQETLIVELASTREFERAGLERSFVLSDLNFEIVERDTQPRIRISSTQPIREPFLNFLIMATSDDGRILREYTVLLDPPRYALSEQRSAPAPDTRAVRVEAMIEPTATAPRQTAVSEPRHQTSSFGPTSQRDTLWSIAERTRPNEHISVQQMMMALFDANPRAFNNANVNGLRAGETLRIPTLEEIETNWTVQSARTAFSEHQTRWGNQIATSVAVQAVSESVSEPVDTSDSKQQVSESVSEQAETTTTISEEVDSETPAESDARLSLVAPSDSIDDPDSVSAQGDPELQILSEQLTLAQETIEAQAQENIDFRTRMEALELQLETLRRLVEIRDADLARLQSIAERGLADLDDSPSEAQDSSELVAEPLSVEPYDDEVYPSEAVLQQADELHVANDADERLLGKPAETLQIDEREVHDVSNPIRRFVNQNWLEMILGALLSVLALLLIARRRKQSVSPDQDKDDTESAVTSTSDDQPKTVEQSVESPLVSHLDPDKWVDELVEQADIFIGYADYDKARRSLEQARLQAPDNLLVAYKLLFVLFKQQQMDEFIHLFDSSDFDETSEQWQDIRGWGQTLVPDDVRFGNPDTQNSLSDEIETQQTKSAEASIAELPDAVPEQDLPLQAQKHQAEPDHIEFDLDGFSLDAAQAEHTPSSDERWPEDTELLDFTTDFSVDEQSDVQAKLDDGSLDDDSLLNIANGVDADELKTDIEEISVDIDMMDSLDEHTHQLDQTDAMDVQLDDVNEALTAGAETRSENYLTELLDSGDDSVDLELNLDDFDAIDEAETKLDLAVAYIDMGDLSVAKNILNEVLLEGSEQQQARAQELLNSLS